MEPRREPSPTCAPAFGLLSSLFDFLTFGVLIGLLAVGAELFRTGWFVESLLSELVIALVVRTRRPFYRSRPGRILFVTSLALIPITFVIPFVPHARVLGFVPMPPNLMLSLVAITALYIAAAEIVKKRFYARAE